MGSRTYYDMAAFWPYSDAPFAAPMNDIPKIIFSRHGIKDGTEVDRTTRAPKARAAGGMGPVERRGRRAARQHELDELNRGQRGSLAQVAAREHEREAALDRRVGADPADEHLVDPGRAARSGELLQSDRGCGCENRTGARGGELGLGLHPDDLRVSDHDRDADAARLKR